MDSTVNRNLQKIAKREQLFFVYVVSELNDIKAMLGTLLALELERLTEQGLSPEQANQKIQGILSAHQKEQSNASSSFLDQLKVEIGNPPE